MICCPMCDVVDVGDVLISRNSCDMDISIQYMDQTRWPSLVYDFSVLVTGAMS